MPLFINLSSFFSLKKIAAHNPLMVMPFKKTNHFITGLLCLLMVCFTPSAGAQTSADLKGVWVGYLKIGNVVVYHLVLEVKNTEEKAVQATLIIADYKDQKKIIKSENYLFAYDRQRKLAYYNTSIPNNKGTPCEGYLILQLDPGRKDFLDTKFHTGKDCMKPELVLARTEKLVADSLNNQLNGNNAPADTANVPPTKPAAAQQPAPGGTVIREKPNNISIVKTTAASTHIFFIKPANS